MNLRMRSMWVAGKSESSMSLQAYQVCGHCNQLLSDKALKEHYRLYFDDEKGVWIKFSEEDKSGGSLVSSPLGFSPPGSDVGSVEEHLSQSSDEQPFEDCDMDLAECSGVLTASTFHERNLYSKLYIFKMHR